MSDLIKKIAIDDEVKKDAALYFNKYYRRLSRLSCEKFIDDMFSIDRSEESLALMKKKTGLDLRGKDLLEIGSGFGAFILSSRLNHGVLSFGLEPDDISYSIASRVLSRHDLKKDIIKKANGERIPHEDNSFDIVYSSNVIEHTNEPKTVFKEAVRVLKPGGFLFFIIPNYASWWEGHYGMIWPPNMPKGMAKFYVRLFGRNPSFIDTLQFLTLKEIKKMLSSFDNRLEVLDLGWDVWEHRLRTLDFSGWAYLHRFKEILKIFHKLRLIEPVIFLGKRFDWLAPIIITAKKT